MLVELVHKREKAKVRELHILREFIDFVCYTPTFVLKDTVEDLIKLDKEGYFLEPINAQAVPDYFDIVKEPMDFETVSNKVDAHQYASVADLRYDVNLICTNAMLYNAKDTPFHRAAVRLQQRVQPILDQAEKRLEELGFDERLGVIPVDFPQELFDLVPEPLPPPRPIEPSSVEPSSEAQGTEGGAGEAGKEVEQAAPAADQNKAPANGKRKRKGDGPQDAGEEKKVEASKGRRDWRDVRSHPFDMACRQVTDVANNRQPRKTNFRLRF